MRSLVILAAALAQLTAGCAQTYVQPQSQTAATHLGKPSRILVYDFATSPDEVHLDQNVLRQVVNNATAAPPPAQRDIALGHQVAGSFAEELVSRIRGMGLRAERASRDTPVYHHDVKIVGAFVDVDQGNQLQRLVIGLGAGASQVDTEVEVIQASERGAVRVAQFSTHADSGEMPGAALTMGAGAAASGGLAAGAAVASAGVGGVNAYRSQVAIMAGRSADQAAAYLAQVFGREGWIAPQYKEIP